MAYGPSLQKLLEDYDRHRGTGGSADGKILPLEERLTDIYNGCACGNLMDLSEIFHFVNERNNPPPQVSIQNERGWRSIARILREVMPWVPFRPAP